MEYPWTSSNPTRKSLLLLAQIPQEKLNYDLFIHLFTQQTYSDQDVCLLSAAPQLSAEGRLVQK